MVIVVMGPSGAGKSTVGARLAAELGFAFEDADDHHPPANVAKMRAGVPLDEADRAPWLGALAARVDAWLAEGRGAVLACSALKAAHRRALRRDPERVRFVYLRVAPAVLAARLGAREGHFMPAALLASQLAALEEPRGAIAIDADAPVEVVVAHVVAALAREPHPPAPSP